MFASGGYDHPGPQGCAKHGYSDAVVEPPVHSGTLEASEVELAPRLRHSGADWDVPAAEAGVVHLGFSGDEVLPGLSPVFAHSVGGVGPEPPREVSGEPLPSGVDEPAAQAARGLRRALRVLLEVLGKLSACKARGDCSKLFYIISAMAG